MNNTLLINIWNNIFLYFIIVLISIGLGFIVINVSFIKAFDNYFYIHINGLPHTLLTGKIIYPFDLWFLPYPKIFFFPAFFYFIIGGFFLYMGIFKRFLLTWSVFSIVLGLILAGILLDIDWFFIFRHRPFEVLPSTVDTTSRHILMKFPSYPSGHVRDTTVVSTIIAYYMPKLTWLMILFVIFIAFTRVFTGAHYPTDVLAGILFGYLIAYITLKIVNTCKITLEERNQAKKTQNVLAK